MSEKIKYELEFIIKTSSKILFNMLSTPSGLSEWFADDVNIRGEIFTFIWDGSEESAVLLTKKNSEYVKFRWVSDEEENEKYFFELRIQIDPLTKEVALMITDFAEEDEMEEAQMLWEESGKRAKTCTRIIDRK